MRGAGLFPAGLPGVHRKGELDTCRREVRLPRNSVVGAKAFKGGAGNCSDSLGQRFHILERKETKLDG